LTLGIEMICHFQMDGEAEMSNARRENIWIGDDDTR